MPAIDESLGDISPETINVQESFVTQEGINDFESEGEKLKNKRRKAELKSYKQDVRERKNYASHIYQMLAFWLMFTGSILFLCAINKIHLSDNVLIILLTTSSANVIAIFIYVVKYLFNSKD